MSRNTPMKSLFLIGTCAAMLVFPISAMADTPPDTADSASGTTAVISPNLPYRVGPFSINGLSGFIGSSESGLAVGVGAKSEQEDGGVLAAEASLGSPVLRVNAQAALFPRELVSTEGAVAQDIQGYASGSVYPVVGSMQLTIPAGDDASRSHLAIHPLAVGTAGACYEQTCGAASLQAGPALGVAHDGDGAAAIIGAKLGVSGILTHDLNDRDRLELTLGHSALSSLTDRFGEGTESGVSLSFNRVLRTGQRASIAVESINRRFNVLPEAGLESVDSGRSQMLRLKVTIAR